MKKLLAVLLAFAMLCASFPSLSLAQTPDFSGMTQDQLLLYVEDCVYDGITSQIDGSLYTVQSVQAIYISEEYLEQLEYNSRSNVFFGYTLEELSVLFPGQQYVFTLGSDHETIVEEFVAYSDDRLQTIIRNVAIGTGVIVICVTLTAVSAGVGAPAITCILAYAADGAIAGAVSGAVFGGIAGGVVSYMQKGNVEEALWDTLVGASEGYKWGAIVGAATGAVEGIGVVASGDTLFFEAGSSQAFKYPKGVKYTEINGERIIDFSDYAIQTVRFDYPSIDAREAGTALTGTYYYDAKLANTAVGYTRTPFGYTWHHCEDMVTMILVPQDLHSPAFGGLPHVGGASYLRTFYSGLVY